MWGTFIPILDFLGPAIWRYLRTPRGRVGGLNEQPRRAVKGLPFVGWYGVWCGS